MARRAIMHRSGVSIRLVPTALAVDAAFKLQVPNAITTLARGDVQGAGFWLQQGITQNAGGVLVDLIAAMLYTKIFPRTPGIRLGRFRVSI